MSRWLGGERGRPPGRARLRTDDPVPAAEAQRRLEQARERLKATIPSPADEDDGDGGLGTTGSPF